MDGGRAGKAARVTHIGRTVRDGVRRADDNGWVEHIARAGLSAYGVVHLLIAWVALQLAFGGSRQEASSKGAFEELASQPFGGTALWAVAIGLALLVLWRVIEAAVGHTEEEGADRWRKRAVSAGKAVLYAVLAFTAFRIVMGDGSDGGGGKSMTATVLNWPGGQVLVVLAGLLVLAYGGWTARRGWSDAFMEHLDAEGRSGEVGNVYRWFGRIGYVAKGVSVGLVGALVVHAGWTHRGKEDQGLDDALRTVLEQPFGSFLLSVVAAGLACYGLFSFARARHLDR